MRRLLGWLGKLVSGERKGEPSISRVAFLLFVLAGAFWLTWDIIASLHTLKEHGISEQWVLAFGIYASACTSGYLGGKHIGAKFSATGSEVTAAPRRDSRAEEAP